MDIILATNNKGKVNEFNRILNDFNIEFKTLEEVGFSEKIDETEDTFSGNAKLKAMTVYKKMKIPVLADDSGLMVECLNGEPGVRSARFSGDNAIDSENNRLLLERMLNKKNRKAKFVCTLCLVVNEETVIFSTGECEGEIGTELIGNNGFGYDPLFLVNGKSFGTMTSYEKDLVSHRKKAILNIKEKFYKLLNKKEN